MSDSWLELLLPEASYAAIINDLMLEGPVKEKRREGNSKYLSISNKM